MKPSSRVSHCLLLLLCSIFLVSCQTSDDATAAAKQLATTSTDLANYFGTLSQIVAADVALSDLQHNLMGVPFTDADRALLTTTTSELQKRADVAKALETLSSSFSNLTGSTAAADVSNAASNLATELTTLKALPQLKGSPISTPSALGDAGKLILSLIQQHEEKKVASALDTTVSALKTLFSQEKDAYDSLNLTYVNLAGSLANYCIDQDLVADTSVLAPALQPFSLTAQLSSTANSSVLKKATKAQVTASIDSLGKAHQTASGAMLQAITDMGTRVHQLASAGKMPARGTPVTLTTVENWINTASTYASGTSSTAPATTKK